MKYLNSEAKPRTIACLHGVCGHSGCFMRVESQTGCAVPLTLQDVAKIPQPSEHQSGGSVTLTLEDLCREF